MAYRKSLLLNQKDSEKNLTSNYHHERDTLITQYNESLSDLIYNVAADCASVLDQFVIAREEQLGRLHEAISSTLDADFNHLMTFIEGNRCEVGERAGAEKDSLDVELSRNSFKLARLYQEHHKKIFVRENGRGELGKHESQVRALLWEGARRRQLAEQLHRTDVELSQRLETFIDKKRQCELKAVLFYFKQEEGDL